ncbi:capsular exopolysaccharide family protein [Chitinispirillum alkaliphilum]|nr:capsular exopolysaccharide family protein [Chitinispirillum alkaliphilum]
MSFRKDKKDSVPWDHYLHLFLRNIWFILPVSLTVLVLWIVVMGRMNMFTPEMQARAVLRFDDPQALSGVDERVSYESESRASLVKSRSFLEQIAAKHSLQLMTSRVQREDVFDSVWVGPDAPRGSYSLRIHNNMYRLVYSNKEQGIDNRVVQRGKLSSLGTTEFPGVYLSFSPSFKEEPFEVNFSVIRLRDAVDFILNNLEVRQSEPLGTILSITLSGRDYPLITQVLNSIVEDFVHNKSNLRYSRTEEIISILQEQLSVAETEMRKAESELRAFRNANPSVGLPDAMLPPSSIPDLIENEAGYRSYVLQARSLRERYNHVSSNDIIPMLNEMVAFISTHRAPTAAGLQRELDYLTERERMFRQDYSPSHPHAIENRNRLRALGRKVNSALGTVISDFERRIAENQNRINNLNNDLAALPAKEIQLSNLQRQFEVNADIYSTILGRYKEARIASSIELGDVSIIDHAVQPERKYNFRNLVLIFGAGLLLSMTAGFGPVMAVDHFDRKARTEKDLSRLTSLLLLESVPVKGKWSGPGWRPENGEVDPKLVSADYSRNFVDETFRSLRAKVLLSLFDEKKKRIVISSLNMSEGKSFTAANLAVTMAQQNIRTLLIDGDMRRGLQHESFGLSRKPGLSNILMSTEPLSSSLLKRKIRPSHISNLSLLPCGSSIPNSAELLNTQRFRDLLDLCSEQFDMLIMDTPPLSVTTDAVGVMDSFNKYLVVVRSAHTNISHLNKKISEFPGLRKKILGIVFNGAPYRRPEYYQYSSYRY